MWPAINAVGFDLFCLANNHIMDEGIEGLVNLKQKLKNISTVGAGETVEEAYSPFYFSKDNVNVGIVNLAENGFGACTKGGYAWLGHHCVEEIDKKGKIILRFFNYYGSRRCRKLGFPSSGNTRTL